MSPARRSYALIGVLTDSSAPNSRAFNLPLAMARKKLRERGYHLQFHAWGDAAITDSDVLFINSHVFRPVWARNRQEIFEFLVSASDRASAILWFDTTDSTGSTQLGVLPYVDRYCKAQLLRDRNAYLSPRYGGRLFTDYYHREFGVQDEGPPCGGSRAEPEHLHKLRVSWSSAYADYGPWAGVLRRLRGCVKTAAPPLIRFVSPTTKRETDVSCRIGRGYRRNTIGYQRDRTACILADAFGTSVSPLPKRHYFRELRNAKIGVSPFGWGEIAYRDYEIIASGCTLVKPDMSHLETWPQLYVEEETYVPVRWDLSDLAAEVHSLLNLPERRVEIASRAQAAYSKALSDDGLEEFTDRLVALLTDEPATEFEMVPADE